MNASVNHACVHLLHVDQNPEHRQLLRHAIRDTETPFRLTGADGLEAAADSFHFAPNSSLVSAPVVPDLVLLEYQIGRHTGLDFLYWLRVQQNLTALPVVMFSGLNGAPRVAECYAHGANAFLNKPQYSYRVVPIVQALYFCMQLQPPEFTKLEGLMEYRAHPDASLMLSTS